MIGYARVSLADLGKLIEEVEMKKSGMKKDKPSYPGDYDIKVKGGGKKKGGKKK